MTRPLALVLACLWTLAVGAAAHAAEPRTQAEEWQQQARDTRAQVVAVAEELEGLGAEGNEDAAGLVADAKHQLAKGDEQMEAADAAMEAGEYQTAASTYNMAWQYYVKAATAGLNARRILTGE